MEQQVTHNVVYIIEEMLSKGETLPNTSDVAKKLRAHLGFTYNKIDAGLNACILHWKRRGRTIFAAHVTDLAGKSVTSTQPDDGNTSKSKRTNAPTKALFFYEIELEKLVMS